MKNVRFCEGKRGQNQDTEDVLEPQAKTKARLEPRRCQKRESTQLLPDLEEEVTSTVLVASGSAPIQGGSSSSADVLINSSVATSMSIEDMAQHIVFTSTSVGIQPSDRMHFLEDPAGNRCKVLGGLAWRCVHWSCPSRKPIVRVVLPARFLPLSSSRELITELSLGFRDRQRIERNRGDKDNDYHGRSGCGWACGRRVFPVSVSCFFFFTMVSNGVDRM